MKNFKVLYLVEVGLCVEIRCAFKVVIRVKHPSPTINDILISAQGTSFSKLCLKSGFHQLESSLASSSLTVFQTEKKKKTLQDTYFWNIYSPRGTTFYTLREMRT